MKFSEVVLEEKKDEVAPEILATQYADEIVRLKLRIEELEARRDEAVEKAFKNGIRQFAGFRFSEVKPSGSISEKRLIEMHPDINDGYVEYCKQNVKVSLTKKGLTEFLKKIGHTNPDSVLADITVAGQGAPTYKVTAMKEAKE